MLNHNKFFKVTNIKKEIKVKKIFCFMIILIISCNNQSPEKLWNDAEKFRYDNKLKECIINLDLIMKNYSTHDLAGEAQFQKAEIYLNDIKDFDFSIEEFKKVIKKYPNHNVAKNSLFMIGYIYNNYLNAYSDAIENYNLFIIKYPDDELIPSVQYEMDGLLKIEGAIDSLNSIVL